jgi:hypothetical protein
MSYCKNTKIFQYFSNKELKDTCEYTKITIQNGYFDKKLDNLSQNLTHLSLHFTFYFNQKVDHLPKNLIHLNFSFHFNQKVDYLPKNLVYLTFGACFNQKVDNLPKNLTHLIFGFDFCQKLDKIPKNIKYLNLRSILIDEIPKHIKNISLKSKNNLLNNIPSHIEKLYIDYFNHDSKQIGNLPLTIKKIIIHNEEYKKYIKVPFGCILSVKQHKILYF